MSWRRRHASRCHCASRLILPCSLFPFGSFSLSFILSFFLSFFLSVLRAIALLSTLLSSPSSVSSSSFFSSRAPPHSIPLFCFLFLGPFLLDFSSSSPYLSVARYGVLQNPRTRRNSVQLGRTRIVLDSITISSSVPFGPSPLSTQIHRILVPCPLK